MAPAARCLSSGARRLSCLFSSTPTKPRAPTQKPVPVPEPKASTDKQAAPNRGKHRKPLKKVLQGIFWERDPDKLVSKFVASSSTPRFRNRHRIYEVAVFRLARFGRHDAVEAILEAQKPFFDADGVGFAARIVRLYGRASMLSHAAATFHDLPPQHKIVIVFNALLSSYLEAADYNGLATAFQEIPASCPTVVPNVSSYNVLIIALCQNSDLSAALDAVALMEKRGVSPDIFSFNTLLNGFYNNGLLDDASKVWNMMKERNIEPDTKSYNAKLRGLVAKGMIQDAAALIEMMEKDGPKPDTVSYNELIRGYCKEGRLDDAKKVFDDFVKNECVPNKGTFATLVPRLLEAGELDHALTCCHQIFSSKCKVDASLLQDVVTALVDASRVEEAKRVVELGRKNYYPHKYLRMTRIGKNNNVEDESDGKDSVLNEEGLEEEVGSRND